MMDLNISKEDLLRAQKEQIELLKETIDNKEVMNVLNFLGLSTEFAQKKLNELTNSIN